MCWRTNIRHRIDKYCRYELEPGLVQAVVPVHDELVIKFHKSLLHRKEEILTDIAELMCYQPEIAVRLDVEFDISYGSWDDKQELKELNKKLASMPR